eukprot:gene837-154_t
MGDKFVRKIIGNESPSVYLRGLNALTQKSSERIVNEEVEEILEQIEKEIKKLAKKGQYTLDEVYKLGYRASKGLRRPLSDCHKKYDRKKIASTVQSTLRASGFNKCVVRYTGYSYSIENVAWDDDTLSLSKSSSSVTNSAGRSASCPICFNDAPQSVLIPCGHCVCTKCGPKFKRKSCPTCRQVVSQVTSWLEVIVLCQLKEIEWL